MDDQPLQRLSLREQVRHRLLERILRGDYEPDERLVEARLADQFGVSVAPVREALRELDALGFVKSSPNRGVRVRAVSQSELDEVYPVRAALEGTAAGLAATRLGGEEHLLRAAVENMIKAARTNDIDHYVQASTTFHRTLVASSGNRLLIAVWNSLAVEARTFISVSTRVTDLHAAARSHLPIVDALARGDAAAAQTLAYQHVHDAGQSPGLSLCA